MADLREAYVAQARARAVHGDHWAGPPAMVDRIARWLQTGPGTRLLDLGCGLGGPAWRLADRFGSHVAAVDLLEPVVALAASAPAPRSGSVVFAVASADALPFADARFDQVWSLGVVAHVEDLPACAAEVARLLVPGGVACFTEAFWDGRREVRFAAEAPRPWRPLSVGALVAALEEAGLDDVRVHAWAGRDFGSDADFSPRDAAHHALRSDLLAGRLVSAMVLGGRRTGRAGRQPLGTHQRPFVS